MLKYQRWNVCWILVLFVAFFGNAGDKAEDCPKTGTSFDPLLKDAYDCHEQFVSADLSMSHGFNVTRDLYCTTLNKTEEEKADIMAMASSSFIELISQSEVQQELKNKLTDDDKVLLDTVKVRMDESLVGLNGSLGSAQELTAKIPDAIKSLPSELKGLNAMKIPKVQGALETAKHWMEEVMDSAPIHIEEVTSVLDFVKAMTAD
jgi:hypothetical protein